MREPFATKQNFPGPLYLTKLKTKRTLFKTLLRLPCENTLEPNPQVAEMLMRMPMETTIKKRFLQGVCASLLMAASSFPAYATTAPTSSGAVDTPSNVQSLQLEVEGHQIITLSDNPYGTAVSTPMSVGGNLAVTGGGTFTGSVGIGTTTSSSAQLDVSGAAHFAGNVSPVISTQGAYISWNGLTGGTGETDIINNPGLGAGGIAFMLGNSTGTSVKTAMFINGSANVGIGVTSPQAKLNILGANADTTADLMFTYDAAGDYRNGIANTFYGGVPASNHMDFLVSGGATTGSVNVMTLTGAGNVGVGTTTPGATLDVNGTLAVDSGTALTSGSNIATAATIQTANNLLNAPTCGTTEALTKTSTGFACIAVSDITGVGYSITVPTCSASQALSFNGTGFTCITPPAGPAGPQGATGATGPTGPTGATPAITIDNLPGGVYYTEGLQLSGVTGVNNAMNASDASYCGGGTKYTVQSTGLSAIAGDLSCMADLCQHAYPGKHPASTTVDGIDGVHVIIHIQCGYSAPGETQSAPGGWNAP